MMNNGMYSMMGPMMAWMMTYGFVVSILVVIVLALLAVWLFQQVRRTSETPSGRGYPPTDGSQLHQA
jgi:hypothetical protein